MRYEYIYMDCVRTSGRAESVIKWNPKNEKVSGSGYANLFWQPLRKEYKPKDRESHHFQLGLATNRESWQIE